MTQPLQYGYLKFQGRGQIARLLLVYTNTPYHETSYSFTHFAEWLEKDKQTLGLDFPSLPYLIHGDFKIAESRAIQKYILHLAKRSDLLGKNTKQKALIDNIDGVLRDIFSFLVGLISAKDFEQSRRKVYSAVQPKLNYLDSFVGSKNHLLSRITYVDFVLNVVFGYFRLFYPHEFAKWQNLERAFQFVNNLDRVSAYYKSPQGVSALLAPEWMANPKFNNLRPINEQIQSEQFLGTKVIQPPEEVRPEPLMVIVKGESESQAVQNATKNSKDSHEETIVSKSQTFQKPKEFTSRVEEYKKATETVNNKNSGQLSQQINSSTIVTPSRMALSASWQINNQQKQASQKPQNVQTICFGYWGIRGLGQVQRHLLSYCGHSFTQKIYKTREQWFSADKLTLGLPFPNLPYLISGDVKITESLAIDRYIIRTSNRQQLLGRNLKDETYIENFVKLLSDLFSDLRALCFTEDQEKKNAQVLAKLNLHLPRFQQFIHNQNFTFGYLTWVDFYIAEISYYIQKIFPQLYQTYKFLRIIRQSINGNSEVQKYYTRTGSISAPFMPPSAKIGF